VLVRPRTAATGRLDALSPSGVLLWSLPNANASRPPAIGADGAIHLLSEPIAWQVSIRGRHQFVLNPDGGVRWSRLGFQPPRPSSVVWPIAAGDTQRFYRVKAP